MLAVLWGDTPVALNPSPIFIMQQPSTMDPLSASLKAGYDVVSNSSLLLVSSVSNLLANVAHPSASRVAVSQLKASSSHSFHTCYFCPCLFPDRELGQRSFVTPSPWSHAKCDFGECMTKAVLIIFMLALLTSPALLFSSS
jgi:hypothetical protein